MKINVNVKISPVDVRNAAIRAAKDYCELMNSNRKCRDCTGSLRHSYTYSIKNDMLIVACGLNIIYSVALPVVDYGNENK